MSIPPKPTAADAPEMERQALAFLAEGKFRKARDEAKLLCKIDRVQYLPLLVKANLGLARDMMSKGQVSDAEQVASYLATIASASELRALELELANRSADFEKGAAAVLPALTDLDAPLPELERLRAADRLVLAFQDLQADSPAGQAVAEQVRSIHSALQALAGREFGQAQEALRPVPQASVVSHWKLFVKGLIAFHQGDQARASRCFSEMTPGTVPAKASLAYLLLARKGLGPKMPRASDKVVEGAAFLAGCGHLGGLVVRAEKLWHQNKPAESYRVFRDALPQFPSEQPDLLGALTDFYFNSLFCAPQSARADLSNYFDRLLMQRAVKNALEKALILRGLSQHDLPVISSYNLKLDWLGFLNAYEQLHGPNPRLASLAYAWLGEQLAIAAPDPFWTHYRRRSRMGDAAGAVEALQRSIQLDPENLEASLRLCDVYENLHRPGDRNRLLDDMVERFPRNKAVLLRAARRCVERKAFAKGLDYLDRARELDLLDPGIADETVRALFGQAREYFKKQRPQPARAALDRVLALAVDNPAHLARARWGLLTQRALIEQAQGDPTLAEPLLAKAQQDSLSPEAFLLYAHLAELTSQRARFNQPTRFSKAFLGQCLKPARAAQALTLLRIHEFWTSREERGNGRYLGSDLLRRYLEAAEKKPFTDEEARRLIEHCDEGSEFYWEVHRFAERVLRRDRKHPWFRLFRLTSRPFDFVDSAGDRKELQGIIEEAARRGDGDTADRARRMLSCPPPPPSDPLPPPTEPWDDEPDDDGFSDELPEDFHDLRPDDIKALEAILSYLSGLSEGQVRRTRKALLGKGMPDFIFDALAEAARQGGKLPELPLTPKTPSANPNQLDLF